jgi:hypothetical protein
MRNMKVALMLVQTSPENGHDLVYEDIRPWEEDVFKFPDQHRLWRAILGQLLR